MLTGVSLFAGIGGFDLAMGRQGIKPVAAVEIDTKASGVLADRFKGIQLFTDIKGVTGGDLLSAGFNPERGIITGGFPCQDLSVAGRRAGLAGERSGLFWEIHRLADETKAKWLVLENVPGLLSSNNGRDMGVVLGSLAELGYGLAYRILDAQHFGVAQRRRRVFIVARLGDDWRTPAKILDLGEGRRGYHQKSLAKGQDAAAEVASGAAVNFGTTGFSKYSEGVSTLTASYHKRPEENILIQPQADSATFWDGQDVAATITTTSNDQYMPDKGKFQAVIQPYVKIIRSGERDAEGNLPAEVWAERETAPTLNLMDNTGESRATVIVFNPHKEDGARIQGDTINTLTAMMGTGGNNVPMIATSTQDAVVFNPHRGGAREQGETINTLTSMMGTSHSNVPMLTAASTVRRLSPTECERLQGFPDGWTTTSNGKPQADSSRYKQTGNAVAVPVAEWVLGRIAAQEQGEV